MAITPHSLGVHKILKHIPLNKIFDYPSQLRLRKAINIADLRLCAKARAHKVSVNSLYFSGVSRFPQQVLSMLNSWFTRFSSH